MRIHMSIFCAIETHFFCFQSVLFGSLCTVYRVFYRGRERENLERERENDEDHSVVGA